jgi:hypothetical protein
VQTVTFRSATAGGPRFGNYSLRYDAHDANIHIGNTKVYNLSYGATAAQWKAALETVPSVDRVSVTRNGDGATAPWSYGYSYTVSFWGRYGTEGIPKLSINKAENATFLAKYNMGVSIDTVREAEYFGDYNSRYLALDENREYSLRMRAYNAKGVSLASSVVTASTQHFGGLPGAPESIVLGQYRSSNSLSLSYSQPQNTGGLPITSYLIETDTSAAFDSSSPGYNTTTLAITPEVQQITVSFRGGDNVKTRGGTFQLTLGGRQSAPLSWAISAFDLEVVMNNLMGTRQVSVAPVTVTRVTWSRGYRWLVTFKGVPGDVGLIQVDDSMLLGDEARCSVKEVVAGDWDIVPGEFTYEVQTIRVTSDTNITYPGSAFFTLSMQGYTTASLPSNVDLVTFRKAIEAFPTIYTVKVTREVQDAGFGLYAWTVTFTHTRKEVVQSSGNLPPMTSTLVSGCPTSAAVSVFQLIKGTHPFQISLDKLSPGRTFYARVTAYNERGYSLTSAVASAVALGPPPAPLAVSATVASATSLSVSWQVDTSADYAISGYQIEAYSALPVNEVQVITTSSSAALSEVQRITIDADARNLAGYFTLEFDGQTTGNIPWDAQAQGDD